MQRPGAKRRLIAAWQRRVPRGYCTSASGTGSQSGAGSSAAGAGAGAGAASAAGAAASAAAATGAAAATRAGGAAAFGGGAGGADGALGTSSYLRGSAWAMGFAERESPQSTPQTHAPEEALDELVALRVALLKEDGEHAREHPHGVEHAGKRSRRGRRDARVEDVNGLGREAWKSRCPLPPGDCARPPAPTNARTLRTASARFRGWISRISRIASGDRTENRSCPVKGVLGKTCAQNASAAVPSGTAFVRSAEIALTSSPDWAFPILARVLR